jgi:DNA-binding NarL/FixJ family response regulator
MTNPIDIIIADDHPIFRKGLCDVIAGDPSLRLLEQAEDGETALRLIQERQPHVAILDINMPRLSGLRVAHTLAGGQSPVKIILLTMHEDEDFFNEAMDIGVSGYVLKENAVADLLQAIRAVAQGKTFVSPSLAGFLLHRRTQSDDLKQEKPGLEMLTPAERRILKLIAQDQTTKEIAATLGISIRTVDTHRQNISNKLNLSGSHSLLKFAYANKSRL